MSSSTGKKRGPKPGKREATIERDAAIAALVRAGFEYDQIADWFGYHVMTVYVAMKDNYPFLHAEVLQDRKEERARRSAKKMRTMRGRPAPRLPRKSSGKRGRSRLTQKELEERYGHIADYFYSDDDITLDQAGEKFGVTRERIRQILKQLDADRYQQYKINKREKRQEAERRQWDHPITFCKVCGEQNSRDGHARVYCSDEHREMFLTHLRYQCDESMHERQKLATAKWVIGNLDKVADYQIREAKRVLAGQDPVGVGGAGQSTNAGQRWLVEGSKVWEIAILTYENDWPVFELFHPDVQQQVKDAVDGSA